MNFLELAKERYSVRDFTEEKITKEQLDKILEVARLSPTAKNKQRQRLIVVDTEEGIEKIKECTGCHFNAKTVIILSYEKEYEEEKETKESHRYGYIDLGIIVSHMALEATNLGLGTTIVGMFNEKLLKEKFNIPETQETLLLLPIGHINKGPSRLHEDRKNIEEIVKYT